MMKIFQKKKNYSQLSNRFKTHLISRTQKMDKILQENLKIDQKIQIFQDLINDGNKPIQKNTTIFVQNKTIFVQQHNSIKKKSNINKLEEKQINQLMQMTQGFNEWIQTNKNKFKTKQKGFSLDQFKVHNKKLKQQFDYAQIFKKSLKLKYVQPTNRQKFKSQEMLHKLQNKFLSNNKKTDFNQTCKHNSKQKVFLQQDFYNKHNKKYKLAKYFGQMKKLNQQRKFLKSNYQPYNNTNQQNHHIKQTMYKSAFIPIQQNSIKEKINQNQKKRKDILKAIIFDENLNKKLNQIPSQLNFIKQNKQQKDQFSQEVFLKGKNLQQFKNFPLNDQIDINYLSSQGWNKSSLKAQINKIRTKDIKYYQINYKKIKAIEKIR